MSEEGAPAEGRAATWYDVAGPERARPVLFVHGVEITRKLWTPQLAGLSDEFRVIAADLPGHGGLADEPFTIGGAVERLASLIDSEAGGRAVVVGLSLGGYVAMALAGRYPSKVAGLVLSGCSWVPRGFITLCYRAYAGLTQALGRRFLVWLHELQFRVECPPNIAAPINDAGFSVKIMPQVNRELIGHDVCAGLTAFPGPVLLLNGRWDLIFRSDERALRALAPQARLEIIPGAAHLSNLHKPAAFNDAVRRLARSVP